MKVTIGYEPRNKKKPHIVRWYGDYNPDTGKQRRYCKSFRLKAEAEQFVAERTVEFSRGVRRDKPEKLTLKDFCRSWLKVKKPQLRPSSVKLYVHTIERLLDYFRETTLLSDLTPQSAETFIAELKPMRGENLSNWTKSRTLRHCKTMFESAVGWGLIGENPFKKTKAPRCITRRWHYIKPDKYLQLLEAAPTLRRKAFYALAYTGGLRKGELFNLTWDDVDFEKNEVRIDNRKGTATMPEFFIKDYEARTVPLPKHTLDILQDLRDYNKMTDQTPYVFLNEWQYKTMAAKWQKYQEQDRAWRNEDMLNNSLREFHRHVKKAGIKPIGTLTIHTLRKCCGKNWAIVNKDPYVTQKLMGHSDLKTTMTFYNQITDVDRTEAAAAIDSLITAGEK